MLELVEVDTQKRILQTRNLILPVQNSQEIEVRARTEAVLSSSSDPRVLALDDGVPVAFISAKMSFVPGDDDWVPTELASLQWVFVKMVVVGVASRGYGHGTVAMTQFLDRAVGLGAEIAGLRIDGTNPTGPRTARFVSMGFTTTDSPSRFAYKPLKVDR